MRPETPVRGCRDEHPAGITWWHYRRAGSNGQDFIALKDLNVRKVGVEV